MNNDEIFECLNNYIKCFRAYRMGDASDEIAQEECTNKKEAKLCEQNFKVAIQQRSLKSLKRL